MVLLDMHKEFIMMQQRLECQLAEDDDLFRKLDRNRLTLPRILCNNCSFNVRNVIDW